MCLTIPGRILSIETSDPTSPMAVVDFAGVEKRVNMIYLPEAKVGNYVLVHAGFATDTMDEAEAREALRYAAEMNEQVAASFPPQGIATASLTRRDALERKRLPEVTL